MSQIRELIRAEFLALQADKTPVTDIVTEVVTDTLARDLPALVRQLVEGLAREALDSPVTDMFGDVTDTEDDVTDTFGNVTDTEIPGLPVTDPNGSPTDTAPHGEATTRLAPQRTRGEMRQHILTLLGAHPEGLSAEELRVYLKAEKPLGDTLQGMRKQQKVRTQGGGGAVFCRVGAARSPSGAGRYPRSSVERSWQMCATVTAKRVLQAIPCAQERRPAWRTCFETSGGLDTSWGNLSGLGGQRRRASPTDGASALASPARVRYTASLTPWDPRRPHGPLCQWSALIAHDCDPSFA
jgi:hypothetical protein